MSNNTYRSVEYLDGDHEKLDKVTREGIAKAVFTNGDVYEGKFTKNVSGNFVRTGIGMYKWNVSGASYHGQYVNGERHGLGEYIYPTGDKHQGEWQHGKKQGKGRHIYTDGGVLHCTWSKDTRHGRGRYIPKLGDETLLEFKHGVVDKGSAKTVARNSEEAIAFVTLYEFTMPEPVEETPTSAAASEADPAEQEEPAEVTEEKTAEEVTPAPQEEKEPVVEEASQEKAEEVGKVEEPQETAEKTVEAEAEESPAEPAAVEETPVEDQASAEPSAEATAEASAASEGAEAAPASGSGAKPLGIIIAGAPASGKGTHSESIRDTFNVIHLSSGDILRAAVKSESEAGKTAAAFMSEGKLVPDEIVNKCVQERLNADDVKENGFLLDGFPRTGEQAAELKGILEEIGLSVDIVIVLDVEKDLLVRRAVGRRLDPVTKKIYHVEFTPPETDEIKERLVHRDDDKEEIVLDRLKIFEENKSALMSFYKDEVVVVDGNGERPEVWPVIQEKLEGVKKLKKPESS